MHLDQYLIEDGRLQATVITIGLIVIFGIIWRFAVAAKAEEKIQHRWTLTFGIIGAIALGATTYGVVSAIVHHDYANIALAIIGAAFLYRLIPDDATSSLMSDDAEITASAEA